MREGQLHLWALPCGGRSTWPTAASKHWIRAAIGSLTGEQIRELTLAIERLVVALSPERIYVFGSHARGDATGDSDVDL